MTRITPKPYTVCDICKRVIEDCPSASVTYLCEIQRSFDLCESCNQDVRNAWKELIAESARKVEQ